MADEWTDWIEHDGSGCPLSPGVFIQFEFHAALNGRGVYIAQGWLTAKMVRARDWSVSHPFDPMAPQVLRYRIRKPRALRQLIELVENLPAPVRESEDA